MQLNTQRKSKAHRLSTLAAAILAAAGTAQFASVAQAASLPGWVKGDFHQHTTYSDGSNPFATVMNKNNQFGLDWWANSEHGGSFNRDAAGPILYSGFDTGGYAKSWTDAVAHPGLVRLGTPTPSGGNMYRWQSLRDFSWCDVLAARTLYPSKMIVQGVEWNMPGHEHCSVGIISGEFGAPINANAISTFEYLYDANDADTSRNTELGLTKYMTNSHFKAVAGVAWMQANYQYTSWMVPAHPERRGVQSYPPTYTGSGSQGYSLAAFRDLNNAGPDVCFGFESMPGHQKANGRGGYGSGASGGGSYGGCGVYAGKVSDVWDNMLAEGRHFWLFANSDFHTTAEDFWPGEYQKNYTYSANKPSPQGMVDGLRSGNTFVVMGDLIDGLDYSISAPVPGQNRCPKAVMGQTLTVASGSTIVLTIRFHSPVRNNHNDPVKVDHVDLISGAITGKVLPTDPNYNVVKPNAAEVIERFYNNTLSFEGGPVGVPANDFTVGPDGWVTARYSIPNVTQSEFFRLRGTKHRMDAATFVDVNGDPTKDLAKPTTPVNYRVGATAAWADLWFYSNPIFVNVTAPLL